MLADAEGRTAGSLEIDERYRGFQRIALGGYTCGLVARTLGDAAEVRLLAPVRMKRALALEARGDRAVLRDGDTVLAEGAPCELELDLPDPPSFGEAAKVSQSFPGHRRHPCPECFGCGTARAEGDGLRLFPGRLPGRDVLALPWIPAAPFAGPEGHVRSELVWSAFDCPQLWSLHLIGREGEHVLTASMAAKLVRPVRAGEPHVIVAWPIGRDGSRKVLSGAAVLTASGELCALSRQTSLSVARGLRLERSLWAPR